MDITKLSNEDLLALQAKQYDKLSDQGLLYLQSVGHKADQPEFVDPTKESIRGFYERRPEVVQMATIGKPPGYQPTLEELETEKQRIDVAIGTGGGSASDAMSRSVGPALKAVSGIGPVSKAIQGLKNFLSPAAKRSEVLSQVKNVEGLEPYVQKEISQAVERFDKSQISPRMLEQQSRMSDKIIRVKPDELRGISPEIDHILDVAEESAKAQPKGGPVDYSSVPGTSPLAAPYPVKSTPKSPTDIGIDPKWKPSNSPMSPASADSRYGAAEGMYGKRGSFKKIGSGSAEYTSLPESQILAQEAKIPMDISPSAPKASTGGSYYQSPTTEITLTGPEALKVREELNKAAQWTPKNVDPTVRATNARAGSAHQGLAEKLDLADSAMPTLSKELQDAYRLKKQAIGATARNPINVVSANTGVSGLSKKSRLAQFDQQAGSNLLQLGDNIKTANDRLRPLSLSDLFSIHGPKQIATKVASPITRSYDAMAEKVVPTLDDLLTGKIQDYQPGAVPRYLVKPTQEE